MHGPPSYALPSMIQLRWLSGSVPFQTCHATLSHNDPWCFTKPLLLDATGAQLEQKLKQI